MQTQTCLIGPPYSWFKVGIELCQLTTRRREEVLAGEGEMLLGGGAFINASVFDTSIKRWNRSYGVSRVLRDGMNVRM